MHFTVTPAEVRVLTRGEFYLTVSGAGVGFLRCGGQRRWVCGSFEEKFLLRATPHHPTEVTVEGVGIAKRNVQRVVLNVAVNVDQARWTVNPLGFPRLRNRTLRLRMPELTELGQLVRARWNAFRSDDNQSP